MSEDNKNELLTVHDQLHGMIDEIDVKLDSLLDPASTNKNRIISERVEAHKHTSDKAIENIVTQLENSPIDQKIGIYYGLIRGLDSAYKELVTKAVDELVANQPKVEPLITEEQAKELMGVRTDLAGKVKSLIEMATLFGNAEGFREPKKRTGKQGKRGPRALSFYTFSVGEKEYKDLGEVAEAYSQFYSKAAEITAAMRGDKQKRDKNTNELVFDDKGKPVMVRGVAGEDNPGFIDTSDPADTFSFTLPNGDVLVGTKGSEDPEEDGPAAENSDEAIYADPAE